MTNREFLAQAFKSEGISEDELIRIACPYDSNLDERALCFGELMPQRKLCDDCKTKWLDSEVDND